MAIFLAACSSETEGLTNPLPDSHQGAQRLLEDFHVSVHKDTRAIAGTLVIDRIDKQFYTVSDGTVEPLGPQSRADNGNADSTFSVSLVTFHLSSSDEQGYAILSDDARISKTYLYTEHGSISDSAAIYPLKMMIGSIPLYAYRDMTKPRTSRTEIQQILIEPVCKLEWHQYSPYNAHMPQCACNDEAWFHQLAGCVTIAVAQYIATCGKFKGTFYGNKDIDFNFITKSLARIGTPLTSLSSLFMKLP